MFIGFFKLQIIPICVVLISIRFLSFLCVHSSSSSRDPGGRSDAIKIKIRGGKRTVYPPSGGAEENTRAPGDGLQMDWVYGYRGRRERRNLWLVNEGEVLYYVGSVAVIFSRVADTQKHYTEHTEDIQVGVQSCRELS